MYTKPFDSVSLDATDLHCITSDISVCERPWCNSFISKVEIILTLQIPCVFFCLAEKTNRTKDEAVTQPKIIILKLCVT